MKRRVLVAAALIAISCTVAVWSQGQRPNHPGFGRPGGFRISCPAMATMPLRTGMIDRMGQTLKLTSSQTAKLKKISAANTKKIDSLQQAAEKSSQSLRSAMLASKYNSKNIKSLAAKAEKAEAAVVNANIDEWTQIRSILTASQLTKLKSTISAARPGPGAGPAGPPPGTDGFRPRTNK